MDIYTSLFAGAALAAVFFAYRAGLRDAKKLSETDGVDLPGRRNFAWPRSKQNAVESDEDRKARIALENIENYGTAVPQKEVK